MDLAIYDEAHRTTSNIYNNSVYYPYEKKLFMTATIKEIKIVQNHSTGLDKLCLEEKSGISGASSITSENSLDNTDIPEVCNMKNENTYGELIYNYSIFRGIKDGIINQFYLYGIINEDRDKKINYIKCLKNSIDKFNLKKVVVYRESIKKADKFAEKCRSVHSNLTKKR